MTSTGAWYVTSWIPATAVKNMQLINSSHIFYNRLWHSLSRNEIHIYSTWQDFLHSKFTYMDPLFHFFYCSMPVFINDVSCQMNCLNIAPLLVSLLSLVFQFVVITLVHTCILILCEYFHTFLMFPFLTLSKKGSIHVQHNISVPFTAPLIKLTSPSFEWLMRDCFISSFIVKLFIISLTKI